MTVTVTPNRHSTLCYRLRDHRGRLPGGKRDLWLATGSKADDAAAKKRLEDRAKAIQQDMDRGVFDFDRWFKEPKRTVGETIGAWVEGEWLPRRTPPLVRQTLAKASRKVWNRYLKPRWAGLAFTDITTGSLLKLRDELLAEGLKLKTARNIVGGIAQAIVRDAIRAGVAEYPKGTPFDGLKGTWPRKEKLRINPFPTEERDAILTYVREKCRHWYAFVLVAFATGMRPSELCGLRWGDVDLRHATLDVRRSRTLHEDNAPKTGASERVVRLPAHVVAVLRDAMPLHVDPDDFVFKQPSGKPVFGESFQKHEWQKILGALRGKVKPRKFYSTRHTCASLLLTKGVPAKFVAEQLGTSLAMLQSNYGKFMSADTSQLDAALALDVPTLRKAS